MSENLFSFMNDPQLAALGEEMEQNLFTDPQSMLVKARVYSEKLVKRIMDHEKLEEVFELKHVERLHKLLRHDLITDEIHQKLDWIRRIGNKAAHEPDFGNMEHALKAHRYLYELSVWYQELYGEWDFQAPPYRIPQPKVNETIDKDQLSEMIRQVIEQTLGQTMDQTFKNIQDEWKKIKAQSEEIKNDKETQNQTQDELENRMYENGKKLPFNLVQYLQEKGLEVIDKRKSGGALWVVGGWELNEVLFPLKEYKVYFRFTKKGGRSTKHRPAWFLLGKVQDSDSHVTGTNETSTNEGSSSESLPGKKGIDGLDSTEIKNEHTEKKETESRLFQVKQLQMEMLDQDQLHIPQHLLNQELKNFDAPVLSRFGERYGILRFQDLTINHLRAFYMEEKEAFFDLLLQLWFLGIIFTGKLRSLFHIEYEDTGEWLEVQSDVDPFLKDVFPLQWADSFKRFGISTLQQMHYLPVHSLKWLLKDFYEEMLRFPAEYSEQEVKEDQKASEKVIIRYQDEWIEIPPEQVDQEITFEDFPGCNSLIRGLKGTLNIQTLGELPSPLDHVHTHLKNVGPAAVKKFWGHLTKRLASHPRENSMHHEGNGISFQGESISFSPLIKEKEIEYDQFTSIDHLIRQLKEHGIKRYEQLPYRLETLCSLSGVGQLKVEKFFQQLKSIVINLEKAEEEQAILKQMTKVEQFQYFFTQFTTKLEHAMVHHELEKQFRIKNRFIEILKRKYEQFHRGHHMTLAGLGEEFGVTRERIRQIVKKGILKLQPIYQPWLDRLENMLEEDWIIENKWIDCRNFYHFIAVEILEVHEIHLHHEIQVISKKPMQEIEKMKRQIQHDVIQQYRGRFVSQEEIKAIIKQVQADENIPRSYAQSLIDGMFCQTQSGEFVLARSKKMDIVEMVLKQFPEGVEIYKQAAELCQRGNEIIPGMFQDEREFTSVFGREDFSEKVYLWGRGTYIHASYVTVPQDLVNQFIEEIEGMLNDRPFVAVNKIYELHQDALVQNQIPNEYALYEILRKHAKTESVAFPKFPRITRPGVSLGKNRDLIMAYIREMNRPVQVKELKEEFVGKRGWQRFTLEWSLSTEDAIIQVDFGEYALLEFYTHITPEVLEPIQQKIDRNLELYPAIQVRGLFYEFESYCKGQGIHSHYLLYSLLKHRFRGQYQFPRYPHIARLDTDIDNLTVTTMIEDYLLDQGCEVSREEVIGYITEEIGAREVTLYVALQHSDKIFYYTRGQFSEFIHQDVIGWNEEKQEQLHRTILEIMNRELEKSKKPFILMDQCFREELLPPLENEIPWTLDLLIECVKRDSYFLLMGSLGRVLLKRENPWKILTETDLITYILQEEFHGAAKKKDLYTVLQTIGFSADGDILHETKVQLQEGTAPFVQIGDEFLMKSFLDSGDTHE